jgi:hypothetical protein
MNSPCRVCNAGLLRLPAVGFTQSWYVLLGLCVGPFFMAGCQPDAAVRPGDIREYIAPREQTLSAEALATRQAATAAPERPRLVYTVPEGWREQAGASGMRLATLLIGEPADGNEVTIIPAAGTLRSNVERWQKQLDEKASAELVSAAVDRALSEAGSVMVEGKQATIVLLLSQEEGSSDGATEAILGGILPQDDGKAVFVKFRGDASVARRERANFMKFVASLRFP